MKSVAFEAQNVETGTSGQPLYLQIWSIGLKHPKPSSIWSAAGQHLVRLRMKPSGTLAPFQELGGDMANATANQRLTGHIKACEQQMSCVYARTTAEAKQIERRVAAGSLEVVMPGLYARPKY